MDKSSGPSKQILSEEGQATPEQQPLLPNNSCRYSCDCAFDCCLCTSVNKGMTCNCMNCCCDGCKCQVATCYLDKSCWCNNPNRGLPFSMINFACGQSSKNYCAMDILFPCIPCLYYKCTNEN